jgi:hypothetical protein
VARRLQQCWKRQREYTLAVFLWYKILCLRTFTMAVQAKNRLCPRCKRELTDEEMANKAQACWLCLAAYLKSIDETPNIPDPATYGRPNGWEELKAIEDTSAIKKLSAATADAPATKESVILTEDERKQMMINFGIDPESPEPVTVITVKGKNDDTYLQFSVRGNVAPDVRKEFERWMKVQLDVMGTILTFGPNYASTLLQMKMMSGMEFLKQ